MSWLDELPELPGVVLPEELGELVPPGVVVPYCPELLPVDPLPAPLPELCANAGSATIAPSASADSAARLKNRFMTTPCL